MEKFVPYEKLSKKKKKELARLKRSDWGGLSPVTRKSANPAAYNRRKVQKPDPYGLDPVPSFFIVRQ